MTYGKNGAGTYVRLQLSYAAIFAVWGSWSYMLGAWASAHHVAQGSLYAAFALGALFAPLVGPIADRKFAAQKVLAFMQTICGLALLACAFLASKEGRLADVEFAKDAAYLAKPSFAWQAVMFIAGFFFLPSIPLLNAIVFKHIPDGSKTPFVFVFGTIGWIVVNWVLAAMGTTGDEYFYVVAGAIALVLAIYALTLPNTPPSGAKNNDPFGLKALALFKRWDFAVFMTCTTLVGIFGSNYYFAFVGMCFPTRGVFNQYSELIFMAALAFAVAKIGLKWVLTLGMLAWGVRYLFFATGNDPLAALGILCHGLAYSFLYSAANIFGDKIGGKELRASTQALIAFWLLGVSQTISGIVVDLVLPNPPKHDAQIAVVTTETACAQEVSIDNSTTSTDEGGEVTTKIETSEEAEASSSTALPHTLSSSFPPAVTIEGSAPKSKVSLATWWDREVWKKYNWSFIFGVPGVFCTIIALIFALLGKEPAATEENSDKE